ncbi:MAG: SEC-C domain-containing protein [Bacteroidetes bacterium]|nr:SEC-C domain-containing protein [Bacteroidota bacterium]
MQQSLNSLCDCGSGKKYKRCCFLNLTAKDDNSFLKKYNTNDLLKTFAALSVLPTNHGKNIRLDSLTADALLSYNTKDKYPSSTELNKFLKANYLSHASEDPPENLFTDRIVFYGGDSIVFPGITGNGATTLSWLIETIFKRGNQTLPKEFLSNCWHACKLILTLSNRIAERASYTRYMAGTATAKKIQSADKEVLSELKAAVTISNDELLILTESLEVSNSIIQDFLIDRNNTQLKSRHVEDNPILRNPIYFDGHEYIIVSPTNLCYALVDWIWSQAKNWSCASALNQLYHEGLWHKQNMYLRQMNFALLKKFPKLDLKKKPPVYWGLYQFDDDKIALVEYAYDDGKNYASNNIGRLDATAAKEFRKHVFETLRADPAYKNFEFFDLVMLSSIGRSFNAPTDPIDGIRTLAISVSEFEVLALKNDCDAIDLWKYTTAQKEQMPLNSVLFSVLDNYKLYKEHNDSFYLSDEHTFTHIATQLGYGSIGFQKQVAEDCDIHSALFLNAGKPAYKLVQKIDKNAPIYASRLDAINNVLDFYVAGYLYPIWVKPNDSVTMTTNDIRHTVFWFTDAISYWLWQATTVIKGRVDNILLQPLDITFTFSDAKYFEDLTQSVAYNAKIREKFLVTKTPTGFNIEIPAEIIPYLNKADNEGERALLEAIISGFNLVPDSPINLFDQIELEKIIEAVAPLGQKKKIYIINTAGNLLMNRDNLVDYRYIQQYDTSVVLNQLVPLLGNDCPPIGEINDRKEKIKLCRLVVTRSLELLTKTISQYNCEELIQRLISLNESLIQKKEDIKITTPTRLACYFSIPKVLADLRESQQNINRTTISVRCLIEHVAAEQISGQKPVSTCAIDELIAIMETILTWGSLGDQLNFDLFDIGMSILPTGRIGTDKKDFKEIFEPYFNSKTQEDLTDAIKLFERNFTDPETYADKDFPKNIDEAFKFDYGISFLRLCYFIDSVAEVGFKQGNSYCTLPSSALFDEVNEVSDEPFEKDEYDAAINYLVLGFRGKVTNRPAGCDNNDISPWRFNRQLSFLRRPLVQIELSANGAPSLYWGAREMLLTKRYIFDAMQSGRLKVVESGKLNKVIGKLANSRGDSLVERVKKVLESDATLNVTTEVTLSPTGNLKNGTDIGDIDCLVVAPAFKAIFSLECKNMGTSRNIKEMVEEFSKLFGSESDKGWIEKHERRHEWLANNLEKVSELLGMDLTGYRIISAFITRESMLSPFLRTDISLPFTTLYNLESTGLSTLIK